MTHNKRWMVVLLIMALLQLPACTPKASTTEKVKPARVEELENGLHRLILVPEAAARLAIQTTPVQEEQITRKRTVGGEVLALPAPAAASATTTTVTTQPSAAPELLVRVTLSDGDLTQVDRTQSVMVLPLARVEGVTGVPAKLVESPALDQVDASALYYALASTEHELTSGQRVQVEMELTGDEVKRSVIPYAAVIYDLEGATWAYTNPDPLTFVRASIEVDYIDGDRAILTNGPPAGTAVVTAGAAELYGEEFGIGH